MPVGRMLDLGHALVDRAHSFGPIERNPDVRIDLARRIQLAHPVVAVGPDAEAGKRVDEGLGVVARVRGVAVAGLVGDMGQRPAHLVLDRVGGQERLGVHRIKVVDPVQQGGGGPAGAQRPGDHVEDHRPAQAADVDGARGAVVDDLRPDDRGGQLVRPIHGPNSLAGPGQLILVIV